MPCRAVPWSWEVAVRAEWLEHGRGAARTRQDMCAVASNVCLGHMRFCFLEVAWNLAKLCSLQRNSLNSYDTHAICWILLITADFRRLRIDTKIAYYLCHVRLSLRPFIFMSHRGSHLTYFREIRHRRFSWKHVAKPQICFKSATNVGHFSWQHYIPIKSLPLSCTVLGSYDRE
jgi:hypothetical protein